MLNKFIKVLFLITLLFSIKTSVSNAQLIGTFDCMYSAPNCFYDPASVTCGEPYYKVDLLHCSKYSWNPSGCGDQKGVSCIQASCINDLGGECVFGACSGKQVGGTGDYGCGLFDVCCLPSESGDDCVDDLDGECVPGGSCEGEKVGETGDHGCQILQDCCLPPVEEKDCKDDLGGKCYFLKECLLEGGKPTGGLEDHGCGSTTVCCIFPSEQEDCEDDLGGTCYSFQDCLLEGGVPNGSLGNHGCSPTTLCCLIPPEPTEECGVTVGDACVPINECIDGGGYSHGSQDCLGSNICCDFPDSTPCENACNDKDYPKSHCGIWKNVDKSICARPPDPNEELDCDIKGKLYDCYCCKDVPEMTDRPVQHPRCIPTTNEVCDKSYIDSNPDWEIVCSGITSAVGCIPFSGINAFVSFFLRWGISVGGGVAFLLILFSGFQIITSSGDPQKLQGGRELLTAAIAGLVMIIFSVFILELIGIRILQLPGF